MLYMKNIRLTLLAAFLLPLLFASGCRKETAAAYLSVDDTFVTSAASGGQYRIGVQASGRWTASFEEEVGWVSLETASGDGDGEIVLDFEANGGLYRFTTLVVSLDGAESVEVSVAQESSEGSPVLALLPGDEPYPAAGGLCEMSYSANVPASELSLRCTADWVSGLEVGEKTVSFNLEANPLESVRRAELLLVCTDAEGTEYMTRSYIVQDSKGDKTGFEGGAENDSYQYGDNYKW